MPLIKVVPRSHCSLLPSPYHTLPNQPLKRQRRHQPPHQPQQCPQVPDELLDRPPIKPPAGWLGWLEVSYTPPQAT